MYWNLEQPQKSEYQYLIVMCIYQNEELDFSFWIFILLLARDLKFPLKESTL